MKENLKGGHSRLGLFGDLPTRAMVYGVKRFPNMPFWIESALLHFFAFIVFLLAGSQRRAVQANLKALFGGSLSWAELQVGTLLVLRNFGWCYLDSLRVKCGQEVVSWDIEGKEYFDEIVESDEATMIFTTHTGNYDLAAATFAQKFGRTLNTVRMPERSEHLQKIQEENFNADMKRNSAFKVHYNDDNQVLGVELARLLSNGELLAIQADRVLGEVVPLEIKIDNDRQLIVPRGPMTLASFCQCRCYPLFVVRSGHRHYKIIVEPAIYPEKKEGQRKLRDIDYAQCWSERLLQLLRRYPYDWFVFEHVFSNNNEVE